MSLTALREHISVGSAYFGLHLGYSFEHIVFPGTILVFVYLSHWTLVKISKSSGTF